MNLCFNHWYNYLDRPELVLEVGRSEEITTVREGDDVYFQCIIKANPLVKSVFWTHNVSLLQHKCM